MPMCQPDGAHYFARPMCSCGQPPDAIIVLISDRDRLQAEVERLEAANETLRSRAWTLRPALILAVKRLREVYPSYEDSHEGGEIWRVIEQGEQAVTETAGPTTSESQP